MASMVMLLSIGAFSEQPYSVSLHAMRKTASAKITSANLHFFAKTILEIH